jgi:hypothetical protein
VAVATLAAALAALIARRDALVAIPVSPGLWLITGVAVVIAGFQLGHTGLADWGWSWSPHRSSEQPPACSLRLTVAGSSAPARR